jgi:uncharacterized membrane protein YGL010W
MVFVPTIFATSVILCGLIPPIPLASNLPLLRVSDIVVAIYGIGYFLLEPVAGTLFLPFLFGCGHYARVLPTEFPAGTIGLYAGIAHVASWVAQFLGHGLAEGRAPALFDNLFQVCWTPYQANSVFVPCTIVCMVGGLVCFWIQARIKEVN